MIRLDHWRAGLLARRAGFGEDCATLDRWVKGGIETALHDLFEREEGKEAEAAARAGAELARVGDVEAARGAWLLRMVTTESAGREKLALVLHDHFATSHDKVQDALAMWNQYSTLREHGPGPFRELVRHMVRDPALLRWLDSNTNRVGHSNENFSRELMELFTLGRGHYTERDVQEAGRAFTGWHVKDRAFWWNERAHDFGPKEVLGRRGDLDGDDVVDVCVAEPACARFLAQKLLHWYLADDPDETWIERMAGWLREEELRPLAALRRLFADERFYAEELRDARVVSPVEWSVGLLRQVSSRVRPTVLARRIADMGQTVFAPPSVRGWPGGLQWISTTTLLARDRFAHDLAHGEGELGVQPRWPSAVSAADPIPTLEATLAPRPLRADARAALRAVLDGAEASSDPEQRIARVAHALWTLPDHLLG